MQASLGAKLKAANVFGPVKQAGAFCLSLSSGAQSSSLGMTVCLHRRLDKDVKHLNGKDKDGEHSNMVNKVDGEHSNMIPVTAPIDTRTGDAT